MNTRNAVRVLLLNENKELLLMCAQNAKITTPEGESNKLFWFPIGGEIEGSESIQEAALREIHEETGIQKNEIILGPIVWIGEIDLVLDGKLTRLKEKFIVAKTKKTKVFLNKLTLEEAEFVKKLRWFSLKKISATKETIFPVLLPKYLPDILSENYPKKPLKIKLKFDKKNSK